RPERGLPGVRDGDGHRRFRIRNVRPGPGGSSGSRLYRGQVRLRQDGAEGGHTQAELGADLEDLTAAHVLLSQLSHQIVVSIDHGFSLLCSAWTASYVDRIPAVGSSCPGARRLRRAAPSWTACVMAACLLSLPPA